MWKAPFTAEAQRTRSLRREMKGEVSHLFSAQAPRSLRLCGEEASPKKSLDFALNDEEGDGKYEKKP